MGEGAGLKSTTSVGAILGLTRLEAGCFDERDCGNIRQAGCGNDSVDEGDHFCLMRRGSEKGLRKNIGSRANECGC
jgi:hypothetical protein